MNPLRSLLALVALSWLLALPESPASARAAEPAPGPAMKCRWTATPITLDGQANEPAWEKAQSIERFTSCWSTDHPPARSATRGRLLWDASYLYFHVEMDDGDLFADVLPHDGSLWLNDSFELLLKPASDKTGYYQFQVDAAGETLDMFVPQTNDARTYAARVKQEPFTWEVKIVRRGTLNQRGDRDEGWSIEGRIPWLDLLSTGARPEPGEVWRFAMCRFDYDARWNRSDLTSSAELEAANLHDGNKFQPLEFVGPADDEVRPYGLRARVPLTTSTVVGTPDPPPPYRAVRAYLKLALNNPIMVRREPGANVLWALGQEGEGKATSLVRFRDDPEVSEFETLHVFDGVAYDVVFHPRFAENGYLYVGWNGPLGDLRTRGHGRVSRLTVGRAAPHRIDAASEVRIVEWPSRGHDGAALAFGHDGYLYITTGDGTADADEDLAGQDMTHLLAKVLRIDVDGATDADRAAGRHYRVPQDNPFVNLPGARPETWAYGLRNPWRMTVDEKTGRLWVAQNGQSLYEQVYLVRRGDNFGWSVTEGSHPYYLERKRGPTPIVPPTAEHPHSEARSLTGGVVYYGREHADLVGAYLYGDYMTGKIWALWHDGSRVLKHHEIADTPLGITAFAIDSRGELIVCNYRRAEREGGLYRLEPSPPAEPSTFPRRLSESGLFTAGRGHVVAPGVVPYSVNSPLWSDGAYKERFIALPGEATIAYTPRGSWNLPEGTVLIKSFALEAKAGDPASRRWVETRFFTKQAGQWAGYSYAWNDEQTDATLVEAAGRDQPFEIADGLAPEGRRVQTWHYPSRAECMICHSESARFVLGVSTAQLNCEQDYGPVRDNQLRALSRAGILNGIEGNEWRELFARNSVAEGQPVNEIDTEWLVLSRRAGATRQRRAVTPSAFGIIAEHFDRLTDPYDASASLAARARSYLHTNCAHCHVHGGGGNSPLLLGRTFALASMNMIDVHPRHATFGLADPRIVAPGRPESSVLLARMARSGPGHMPSISTSLVDEQAVALIRAWIAAGAPER